MVRSTLLRNRLRGATLANRGVLHSVWPGPLWTNFSPVQSGFQNPLGDGIPTIFDDLSHGVHDFSPDNGNTWRATTFWHFFGVIMTENMKMKPDEPRKGKHSKAHAKISPHANFH